ncbi:MAG: hypothetical protein IIT39_07815 [Clostridia bacterium]|nr:hypothetical protein [Clostridia bacterium]
MKSSPEKYGIENDNGEYTSSVLNDRIFGYDMETEDIKAMLKDMDIHHKFCDSLADFLKECGYTQTTDIKQMKRVICDAYSSLNEENTVSEKTVGRWLIGENRPNYTAKSREYMFMLMFALKASLLQTVRFFLKAYYAQPFNFRNRNECIYYWCLKNHCSWQEVQEMKKAVAEKELEYSVQSFDGQTILIGKALDELDTVEEAVTYIAYNILPEETYFRTARQLFKDLIAEAKELAETASVNTDIQADKKDSLGYRRQKNSVDFLLSVIFGTKEKIKPDKQWNFLIKENFPGKEQFSRCFNGDVSNADLLRKSLILLMFFIAYTDNPQTEFDDFFSNVNYQLEECGFPLLYPANPYDRIFLVCAFNGTAETTPLEYFREIFWTY